MSKVLIVYLGSRGGGVMDTYEMCNAFCKVGKNEYSLIISENNPLKENLKNLPLKKLYIVKTHKLSLIDFILKSLFPVRLISILRIIRKEKPSIVFFTMFHPWLLGIAFYIKLFMPKTILVFIRHNPMKFESIGSGLTNKVLTYMEDILTYKCDYIFTFSDYVKQEVIKNFKISSDRIFSFILGAYNNFCKDWSHRGFFKGGVLKLLFFGRILEYKGLDVLIKAYERLKGDNIPVELTIAGEGLIENNLLEEIQKLRIKLLNYWVSDEELCVILKETDLVVLPYKRASQSGPASIALALGIPVIATNIGGLREQVKDGVNGLLIEPDSPKALAEAVKKIYKEPWLLENFSQGAKALSKNEFSWTQICKKMDEIFTQWERILRRES